MEGLAAKPIHPIRRVIEQNPHLSGDELLGKIVQDVPECGKWPLEELMAVLTAVAEDMQTEV